MSDRDPHAEAISPDEPTPQGKRRLRAVEAGDEAPTAVAEARRMAEDLSAAAGQARADTIAELAEARREVQRQMEESTNRLRAEAEAKTQEAAEQARRQALGLN